MQARALLLVNVLALAVVAAAPSRGSAQSVGVQAQSLFDEGRKQMKAGKLAEACAAFEASEKLDPAVTTLLNLAECREQNRQLATAWGVFVDANRMARNAGNDKLAKVATSHARKLEPRLSRLTISVPADHAIPGLAVLRGKDPIDPVGWNHALPIDGGNYTVTARAPGREPWSATRTIKPEGDALTIEIPRLAELKPGAPPTVAVRAGTAPSAPNPPAATPAAPPAATPAAPPAATPAIAVHGAPGADPPGADRPATAPARPPSAPPVATPGDGPHGTAATTALGVTGPGGQGDPAPSRVVPIALGAGALVLGGTAIGFVVSGNRFYDRAKAAKLQVDRDALYHSANTRRYVAEVTGVAALGCAGAAVYFYLAAGGERRSPATAVTPVIAPDLAGVALAGRW